MADNDVIARGRRAAGERRWLEAFEILESADAAIPLDADDLEVLAVAGYMLGRDEIMAQTLGRAHQAYLDAGRLPEAVRSAFYLGISLALRGEIARAGGWLGRAQRVLDDHDEDWPERGYLLLPAVIQMRAGGEYEKAIEVATRAAEYGERHDDADLTVLGRHEAGLATAMAGRVDEGLRLLDEIMVVVADDELSPMVTGIVYCSVIAGCHEIFAWRRAAEWTMALSEWCEGQPDLVAFTGQCLSHRSEVMQHRGDWAEALAEAERACERFDAVVNQTPAGRGHYCRAEIHRLQGRPAAAEEAYREANRFGWQPQPGLALLRLQQGDADAADASIRRALGETTDTLERARLLPAFVEIMVAVDDIAEARAGSAELIEVASQRGVDILDALAAHATGVVELADGLPREALVPLRRAWRLWHDLGAPYEAARSQALIGMACKEVGDGDGADLELTAARDAFARLGAGPDRARVEALITGDGDRGGEGLTDRELEVLSHLASGKANKEIASELHISVRTIDRHVSNIFLKLGVSSRTAAAAYAYRHRLA